MGQKTSREDIAFLQTAYTFGSHIGVTPSFQFNTNKIKNSSVDKVRSSMICVCLFAKLYWVTIYHNYLFEGYNRTHKWLTYSAIVSMLLLACLTTLIASFYKTRKWLTLNKNFREIDRKLMTLRSWKTNGYPFMWRFVLGNILTFGFSSYITFGMYKIKGRNVHYLSSLANFYGLLSTQYTHFFLYQLVAAFHGRYKDLAKIVKLLELLPRAASNLKKILREIQNVYILLRETADIFNEIFGWTLLLIAYKSMAQILIALNFFVTDLGRTQPHVVVFDGVMAILSVASISLLVSQTDRVESRIEKMLACCYRIKKHVTEQEERELLVLIQILKNLPVTFHAANFFSINKTFLLNTLAMSTTHLIVIVQFNVKEK